MPDAPEPVTVPPMVSVSAGAAPTLVKVAVPARMSGALTVSAFATVPSVEMTLPLASVIAGPFVVPMVNAPVVAPVKEIPSALPALERTTLVFTLLLNVATHSCWWECRRSSFPHRSTCRCSHRSTYREPPPPCCRCPAQRLGRDRGDREGFVARKTGPATMFDESQERRAFRIVMIS